MSRLSRGETRSAGWIPIMSLIIVCWLYMFHPVVSESNLALKKKAIMSNANADRPPGKAVDGDLATNEDNCALSRSGALNKQFWYVDLGNTYQVTSVGITTTSKVCCDSQLESATIYVSRIQYSSPKPNVYNTTEKCRDIKDITSSGLPRGVTTTIECASPKIGQFVYIQDRDSKPLTLCEVQVYGIQEVTSSTARTTAQYSTKNSDKAARTTTLRLFSMSAETDRSNSAPLSVRESLGTTTAFTTSSHLPMKMELLITIAVVPPLVLLVLVTLIIIGLKTRRKKDKAKPEDGHQPENEAIGPLKDSKEPERIEPEYEGVEETNHAHASSQCATDKAQSGKGALAQESKEPDYAEVNKTTHNQASSPSDTDKVQGSKAVLVLDGKVADLYAHVNKEKKGKSANVINANADDIANLYAVPGKRKKKDKTGDGEDDQDFPLSPENAAKEDTSQGDKTNDAGYTNTKYANFQNSKCGSFEKESDYSEVEENVTALNVVNTGVEVTEKLAGEENRMNKIAQGVEQAEGAESTYYNLGPATGREEISEANVYANV